MNKRLALISSYALLVGALLSPVVAPAAENIDKADLDKTVKTMLSNPKAIFVRATSSGDFVDLRIATPEYNCLNCIVGVKSEQDFCVSHLDSVKENDVFVMVSPDLKPYKIDPEVFSKAHEYATGATSEGRFKAEDVKRLKTLKLSIDKMFAGTYTL
jgi:hypothetical protein